MKNVKLNNLCMLVTDKCNFKCPWCVNEGFVNKRKVFMTKEVFLKGLEWAKNNGKKGIVLNGGEPTLHPDLQEFALLAKNYGLGVYLFTNYSFPDVVKKLDLSGALDKITISYYNQKELPKQKDFKTNIWLSTLVWRNRFKSLDDFDRYIDSKRNLGLTLFFQTLKDGTEWARENKTVDFLEKIFDKTDDKGLYNKKEAILYKNCIIKFNNKEAIDYPRHNMTMYGEIRNNFK